MADCAGEFRIQPARIGKLEQRAPRIGAGNHDWRLDFFAVIEHQTLNFFSVDANFFRLCCPERQAPPRKPPQTSTDVAARKAEHALGTADEMVQETKAGAAGARPLLDVEDAHRRERSL